MFFQILTRIIITALLIYATVTDVARNEVPLLACAAAFTCVLAVQLYSGLTVHAILLRAAAAGLMFVIMFVNTVFFNGGGGDCILMAVVGFTFGITHALLILALSCVLLMLYNVIMQKKKKSYPMAPAILIGTIIVSLL